METIFAILAVLGLLILVSFGIALVAYVRSGRYETDTRLSQVGKGW